MLVFSIAKLNYWERIGHHWQRISFILSLFFPPHSRVLLELTLPKKPLILFSQMTILAALSRLLCGVAMFTTVSRNFFNSNWRSTLWLLLLPLLAHVQYKTRHWRYVIKNLPLQASTSFFFLIFFSCLGCSNAVGEPNHGHTCFPGLGHRDANSWLIVTKALWSYKSSDFKNYGEKHFWSSLIPTHSHIRANVLW